MCQTQVVSVLTYRKKRTFCSTYLFYAVQSSQGLGTLKRSKSKSCVQVILSICPSEFLQSRVFPISHHVTNIFLSAYFVISHERGVIFVQAFVHTIRHTVHIHKTVLIDFFQVRFFRPRHINRFTAFPGTVLVTFSKRLCVRLEVLGSTCERCYIVGTAVESQSAPVRRELGGVYWDWVWYIQNFGTSFPLSFVQQSSASCGRRIWVVQFRFWLNFSIFLLMISTGIWSSVTTCWRLCRPGRCRSSIGTFEPPPEYLWGAHWRRHWTERILNALYKIPKHFLPLIVERIHDWKSTKFGA